MSLGTPTRRSVSIVAMRIELLFFDGCPNHEAFLPVLRRLLDRAGVHAQVLERRVESEEAAEAARFLGSPTLRVDGVDVDPAAGARDDFGLKCRLYATRAGLRGMPTEEDVLAALDRARRDRASG